MWKRILLTSSALALMSGAAHAFELEYANITLNYQDADTSVAGVQGDGFELFANSRYRFADQFSLDVGIGYADASVDNSPADVSAFNLSLVGRYHFTPNFNVGLFLDYADANQNGGGPDIEATLYGVTFGFNVDNFYGEAYFGEGDYDVPAPGASLDTDVAGLSLGYAFDSGFDFGAFVAEEDLGGLEISEFGLFFGYIFGGDGSAPPIQVHASFSQIDIDPGTTEVDVFRIGVTVPLGGTPAQPGFKTSNPRSSFLRVGTSVGSF